MKQVVQDVRSGQTRVVDVPVPKAAPGSVLIRTAASLVSAGTERTLVEFAGRSLIGKARARKLCDAIWQLEKLSDVRSLRPLLRAR